MALITKMHRCAFCGSSEVTVSENGTYTCRDCGKTADHGMPAADVEAINRILMTGATEFERGGLLPEDIFASATA